jgi:hypothetical protein
LSFVIIIIYTIFASVLHKTLAVNTNFVFGNFEYSSLIYASEIIYNLFANYTTKILGAIFGSLIAIITVFSLLVTFFGIYIRKKQDSYKEQILESFAKATKTVGVGILLLLIVSIATAVCVLPGIVLIGLSKETPQVYSGALFYNIFILLVLFANISIIQVYYLSWVKDCFTFKKNTFKETRKRIRNKFWRYLFILTQINLVIVIITVVIGIL